MAPPAAKPSATPAITNGQTSAENNDAPPIGPPSGLSSIPTQYIPEQTIQQMLKSIGYDQSRDDGFRTKGVQLIDNVREALQLPVKTFDTAAIYYHKFRMRFKSSEYNYEDVALASLFVACKAEDTIKKSREILCAAHNLRHSQASEKKTPDDKQFESPSRFTVGLERHILETIGFDFRVQYPQKLLVKMLKDTSISFSPDFKKDAYHMSVDMYKTFAPIKQTTYTMVLAILELTALLTDVDTKKIHTKFVRPVQRYIDRGSVLETMLDLLDLYTQFPKSTKVGARTDLAKLMDVKITVNNLITEGNYQRFNGWCDKCIPEVPDPRSVTPGSATSPANTGGNASVKRKRTGSDGTLRFVFDAEAARAEKERAAEFFNDEYEEYETEIEEEIKGPKPEPRGPSNSGRTSTSTTHDRSYPHHHGQSYHRSGGGGGGGGRHGYPDNRHRSRRGHGGY
ncbi:CTD kinase subunit beta [Podospora australis]|uniref:RNA polymerase II holoenzyme cyclin-like subunit n=1 Tax=Podospora australis TaxID=1536484 RepID=A0AAN6WXS6_9PEZI|nr:CTD kinase subunit beta [Podospora australis]